MINSISSVPASGYFVHVDSKSFGTKTPPPPKKHIVCLIALSAPRGQALRLFLTPESNLGIVSRFKERARLHRYIYIRVEGEADTSSAEGAVKRRHEVSSTIRNFNCYTISACYIQLY